MSGYVGDLSPEQEAALVSFREAVADIADKPNDSDHYYLRWLRARKFEVEKSELMFRNHMDVRSKYGLDTILQDWTPPEVITKYFPGGFFGEDSDGHPVYYDHIGRVDLRGLYYSVKLEDIIRSKLAQLERREKIFKDFSERKGRVIESVTLVLDFEGLTFHRALFWPGLDIVRQIIKLTESNAPESSKTTLIVRAPSIFPMMYQIVKPMMAEKTRQKINILGSNWQEELRQYIDPDQLPQIYGGTRCEPDEWCSDHITPGDDIPVECYLSNHTQHNKDEMERVTVARGRSHVVKVEVMAADSILKWEFLSVNFDLCFGVYHEVEGKHKEEVIPLDRKNCHIFPESGAHICQQTGTYIVKFDNSYSWTRAKELYYSLEVVPPSQATPTLSDSVTIGTSD